MSCADCIHIKVCQKTKIMNPAYDRAKECVDYKDNSQFVKQKTAFWIKNEPNVDVMRKFHELGVAKAMNENSIFWTCSNCGLWGSPVYNFCPSCGAKIKRGDE